MSKETCSDCNAPLDSTSVEIQFRKNLTLEVCAACYERTYKPKPKVK